MWEWIMGILSDLFGAGKARDQQQDTRIEELFSRVLTLEQSGPGGVSEAEFGNLVERVDTQTAVLAGLTGQVSSVVDSANTLVQSTAGLAQTAHALHERVTTLEQEIEDVRVLAEGSGSGNGDGSGSGGITLPEINP